MNDTQMGDAPEAPSPLTANASPNNITTFSNLPVVNHQDPGAIKNVCLASLDLDKPVSDA